MKSKIVNAEKPYFAQISTDEKIQDDRRCRRGICDYLFLLICDFLCKCTFSVITKIIISALALVGFCSTAASATQTQQARALFYQGNASYNSADFAQAVAAYEGVLTLGVESGALYYNLGNAYFKQGVLGKAILNYLRAQRLIPADADLQANLAYAQAQIKGGLVQAQRSWFGRVFFELANAFTLNGLTLFSAMLYFSLAGLLITFILSRSRRKILVYLNLAAAGVLLITISLFCGQFYQTVVKKQAVVVAESTDAKFEPLEQATTFFTLNEGENVSVGVSKEEWVKIRRVDNRQGWVKSQAIELL